MFERAKPIEQIKLTTRFRQTHLVHPQNLKIFYFSGTTTGIWA